MRLSMHQFGTVYGFTFLILAEISLWSLVYVVPVAGTNQGNNYNYYLALGTNREPVGCLLFINHQSINHSTIIHDSFIHAILKTLEK
jgi:hypothetical protein